MLKELENLLSHTTLEELRKAKLMVITAIVKREKQKTLAAKLWPIGKGIIK
jgi:hypothetical protein